MIHKCWRWSLLLIIIIPCSKPTHSQSKHNTIHPTVRYSSSDFITANKPFYVPFLGVSEWRKVLVFPSPQSGHLIVCTTALWRAIFFRLSSQETSLSTQCKTIWWGIWKKPHVLCCVLCLWSLQRFAGCGRNIVLECSSHRELVK